MENLFNLKELSIGEINNILNEGLLFKQGLKQSNFHNRIVANLFFEPSTRTHYSFDIAAKRLGCQTINFNESNSSTKKGETLYDTVKTFEALGVDLLVIRHPQENYYHQLQTIKTPIINGGDGAANHPTQSLLDLLTIKETFQEFKNLKIVLVGDIKHSRVAKTNIEIMKRLGMKILIAGPEELKITGIEFVSLADVIADVDIVMLLRYQFERFDDNEQYQINYLKKCQLTKKLVSRMHDKAIILHPAPFNRDLEIASEVVECQKSRIFEQMRNGLYIRMALINHFLTIKKNITVNYNLNKGELISDDHI